MEKPRQSEPCLSAGRSDEGPPTSRRARGPLDRPLFLTLPPSPGLKSARAIVRALRTLRREGQNPEVIVMGPFLYLQLQDRALSYLWSGPEREAMFDVPVEIEAEMEGWTVRVW